MAHYAILDKNNIVTQVIVGKDENEPLLEGYESWEQYYGGLRTSYNTFANEHLLGGTPFRGNFASRGYKYDLNYDIFIPLQPFPSWWFDYEAASWKAPVPDPTIEGKYYKWDEQNKAWVEFFPPQA
jgi:hypothetical protein